MTSLGRGLVRSFAFATLSGMVVFAVLVWIFIYRAELNEECMPGVLEEPPSEIAKECAYALMVAMPFGVGISIVLARQLTRATTERLDGVIATATKMTGERLEDRLPVSAVGDPLDRLAEALNGVLERIERGVSAQKQFAADASHELRTPLTVISTNLEVARRRQRDVAHWEHVADDTLSEVRRMHILVEKLLVLSRAGAAGLQKERRDLRALTAVAIERAQPLAAERSVKLDLAAGTAVEADIDADAIAIVIDNLLRNAIEHSPSGAVVSVSVDRGGRIVVDDHGPGVPPELRTRVFEPFARGGRTDRASGHGLGLGLAICKRIVAGHQGEISVEERPGGGARFIVELRDS